MKTFNRYKDIPPTETIERNKKILEGLGIEIEEEVIHNTNNIWTSHLNFPSICFGTNGKGTTELFCKASAYGEALERIQNGICSVQWKNATKEAYNSDGFNFFIDEKKGLLKGIFNRYPYFYAPVAEDFYIMEHRYPSGPKEMESLLRSYIPDEIRYIPFFDYKRKNIEYLPFEIVEFLSCTNGLCSGNTPHEALVQGLSEVCERFVEPFIYKNHLTPPEVPKTYIEKNYSYLFNIINELEKQSNSFIYVYDCSIGKQFPVVCVLMIEKSTQTYRVQYGSHPLFSIALERCLTELTQGYNISNYADLRNSTTIFNLENAYVSDNMEDRFINGNGNCNVEFFFKKPSWEWNENNFISTEGYTNKKGFDFLINTLSQVSENIFIRDNSILGVPAYAIFIPGVNTFPLGFGWCSLEQEDAFNCLDKLSDVKETFIKLQENSTWKNVCKYLLDFLNSHDRLYKRYPYININYFSNYESLNVIKACLCREMGNIDGLIFYLESLHSSNPIIKGICLEEKLVKGGIDEDNRLSIIEKFLGITAKNFIEDIWRNPKYLQNIVYQEEVLSDEEKTLYQNQLDKVLLSIKEVQKKNGPIDQKGLEKLL